MHAVTLGNMVNNIGVSSRFQTSIGPQNRSGVTEVIASQSSFQSIAASRTAESRCRLPASRPPIAPPPPALPIKSEEPDPDEIFIDSHADRDEDDDNT